MNWTDILAVRRLTFSSTGYTSAVSTDIGKIVRNGDQTITGELLFFDNSTRVWTIELLTGTFTTSLALTINTGTGAGTTSSVATGLATVTGTVIITPFDVFDGDFTSVQLTGTPISLNSSSGSLLDLSRNSLNAGYIGFGEDGKPALGCVRPANGLMYPRKI
jgi:hypothetical protein